MAAHMHVFLYSITLLMQKVGETASTIYSNKSGQENAHKADACKKETGLFCVHLFAPREHLNSFLKLLMKDCSTSILLNPSLTVLEHEARKCSLSIINEK